MMKSASGLIIGHEQLRILCDDLPGEVHIWKKDGSKFQVSDFVECSDNKFEAGLSNGSRLSVKLEGTAFTKEYVTARLYKSSHIKGFFDFKVGYPVVQNIYDTGRYDAKSQKNLTFFMCSVLRISNFSELLGQGEIKIKENKRTAEHTTSKTTSDTFTKTTSKPASDTSSKTTSKPASETSSKSISKPASETSSKTPLRLRIILISLLYYKQT